MNEANTWEWLRDVVLPLGHYSRIESPDTAPGFPDVQYQIDLYCCGTLELKCNRRNATIPFPDEEKGLHKSQLTWIKKNVDAGGVVWIIAEVNDCVYVISGVYAKEFNGATRERLDELAIAQLYRSDPENAAKILANILET